jgi:hypothetical protein
MEMKVILESPGLMYAKIKESMWGNPPGDPGTSSPAIKMVMGCFNVRAGVMKYWLIKYVKPAIPAKMNNKINKTLGILLLFRVLIGTGMIEPSPIESYLKR